MQVSEHCYALTGLAYTAPWSLNAGFIVGSEVTLVVDTAATAASAATIHGYAVAARRSNRIAVINTERHFDHIGGNGFFRDKGCEIYGHATTARSESEFDAEIAEFNDAIPNAVRRERNEAKVFYAGTALAFPNRLISADSEIELGKCAVRVLLTPGHTPSNISVFVPLDGVLYSGDCLVNGYLPNLEGGAVAEWREWLKSIDRIERLSPKVVVPGHGQVLRHDGVATAIEKVRSILETAVQRGVAPTQPAAHP